MTIEVENLGKRFRKEWIFRQLTATFREKQVYAIVGPNGSGKSTLLQILWGQLLPSLGTVAYFNGDRRIEADEAFRHLSIAAPYMDLIDEFTMMEMIEFHFRFKQLRPGVRKCDLPELIGLAAAKNKRVGNFSSGMRQRLKLALAFYADTPLLFLDEPTTNLDETAVAWYRQHLHGALPEKTVFIASNQAHEYPASSTLLNMADYKQ